MRPSGRLRRLPTTGPWLALGFERAEDVAGSTPVPASCVIVEIPAPTNGSRYGQAPDQLAGLVDTTHLGTSSDLNGPVQVTFTGAAFFDGYHQKTTQGVKRASQRGALSLVPWPALSAPLLRCSAFSRPGVAAIRTNAMRRPSVTT